MELTLDAKKAPTEVGAGVGSSRRPVGGRGRLSMGKRQAVLAVLLVIAAISALALRPSSARYDLPDGIGTVEAVEMLAARHEHGWDDQLPADELDAAASERPIRSTCGYVSPWVVRVLEREGHEARVVETLTLDEWDGVNNGHVLIEARVDGEWVVFDVDRDVWFWRDGQPLSLIGYVEAVEAQDYEIRPLSGDPADLVGIRADDERLIQVPFVRDGDASWFFSTDPERVQTYASTYQPLPEDEWRERFYST